MTEAKSVRSDASKILLWLFAVLGGLAAIALIWLAVVVAGFTMGRAPHDDARVEAKGPAENFIVQQVADIRGTDFVQIQIGVGDGGRGSYSSGPGGPFDQRNLILLNRVTGDSRRLLNDNARHVTRVRFFPAEASRDPDETNDNGFDQAASEKTPRPPAAYYLLSVRQAQGPLGDVLIGDFKTGQQAFVLTGVDGIDSVWMLSPTRMAILMREKRKLQYRVIDLPTLKIVTARPVEIG